MPRYAANEPSPGPSVATDADGLNFSREKGQTVYHPLGTCRMGEDEAAVADVRRKLRGLACLRVGDASVMPTMVSGNIQAAGMMVAEKGCDLIQEDAARR